MEKAVKANKNRQSNQQQQPKHKQRIEPKIPKLPIESTNNSKEQQQTLKEREDEMGENELIQRAGRTAQILLQDEGVRLSRTMRRKIIDYQGDLGHKILMKQARGLAKFAIIINNI